MKKVIIKTLCVILVGIFLIGSTTSLAMQNETETLRLSPFRYVDGNYTNGYALGTVGGESRHPIYQIIAGSNRKSLYCLNATAGQHWIRGEDAVYNRTYDLSTDLEQLKGETSGGGVYKKIADSEYLKQILWILDNIYISNSSATSDENLAKKQALLERAGIVNIDITEEGLNGPETVGKAYKYQPVSGYDYSDKISNKNTDGYYYFDNDNEFVAVDMPDELVEVAQQAALWYYTNYLGENDKTYDVIGNGDAASWFPLVCSNGTEDSNSQNWKDLAGDFFDERLDNGDRIQVGQMKQEMSAILCSYLIDAANNYAENPGNTTGQPLEMTSPTTNVEQKAINGEEYYIVGPIKIEEKVESVYSLLDTIIVNGSSSTGAYTSNVNGSKLNKTISSLIGQDFYITVPKSSISENNIKIEFEGSYNTNEKKLWVSTNEIEEQPIVEVTPVTKDIELSIIAQISPEEEFDLALRKVVTSI